jgi:hypothetical protein
LKRKFFALEEKIALGGRGLQDEIRELVERDSVLLLERQPTVDAENLQLGFLLKDPVRQASHLTTQLPLLEPPEKHRSLRSSCVEKTVARAALFHK